MLRVRQPDLNRQDIIKAGTQLSIAAQLIEDSIQGVFNAALLISADSDLCPAVRSLKRLDPGKLSRNEQDSLGAGIRYDCHIDGLDTVGDEVLDGERAVAGGAPPFTPGVPDE